MACKSTDARAVALGAETVVTDVFADLYEQIDVVCKTALIQVKDTLSKNAAYSVAAVVAEAPKTFPARVVEMRRVPGLVGEALFFGSPAQLFCYVAAVCGAATGLSQFFPGCSRDGEKGWGREHVDAFVDVIGGLS